MDYYVVLLVEHRILVNFQIELTFPLLLLNSVKQHLRRKSFLLESRVLYL